MQLQILLTLCKIQLKRIKSHILKIPYTILQCEILPISSLLPSLSKQA